MTECTHKTGTVLLDVTGVQIVQCDWVCGALLVSTPMMDYEVDNPAVNERQDEINAIHQQNELLRDELNALRQQNELLKTELENWKNLAKAYKAAIDGGALE